MKKIRQSINQSWQIIKQNKLYSFFYILGTALAISMVMVIAIGYNLKIGNLYPEVNRDRTLVLDNVFQKEGEGGIYSSFNADAIKKLTANIEEIETICLQSYKRQVDVQKDVLSKTKKKYATYYNENIWKTYRYDFIEGAPFTQEEVESSIPKVVISASTAKTFWGSTSAIGKKIWIDYREFTVCGLVKDISPLMSDSYADIYIPHTLYHEEYYKGTSKMLGRLEARIVAKSPKDFDKIKTQIEDNLAKINNTLKDDKVELDLLGGPKSFIEENLTISDGMKTTSSSTHILQIILVVLIIIMVPAINLSGIISTEMEDREAEVGIRKAFGAPSWKLLYRLINENLLLSFMGGVLGILVSYLLIYIGYHWFLNFLGIHSSYIDGSEYSWLKIGMLIDYSVLFIALISCFLMNLLSSFIPQYFSTKKNIINLLNRNHIARGGKSKKRKSIWIFLELVTVFVIAWMVIDPLYVLNYQKSIQDGFEYNDLYEISISSESYKSPKYKKETQEEITRNSNIIVNIVKEHPFVENVEIESLRAFINTDGIRRRQSVCCNLGDSSTINVRPIHMSPTKNNLLLHGIKISENFDDANSSQNAMLISKSVAEKFFGKNGRVAKTMVYGGWEYPVVGVIDDMKAMEYTQPMPTIITPLRAVRRAPSNELHLDLLVKSKLGISEAKFLQTLEADLKDKVTIGSRYFEKIEPYHLQVEEVSAQTITPEKNTYTLIACFVLFNMFLGIFATFWLQSKKRRGEIGLRMAMGSSKKKVSRMFVMESVKMASLASLIGMIVVGNIVYFKGMFTYGEFQNPVYWAVTNDTAHFIIVSLIAYAVILITVTLGTLIPASKAANTNPVDALRDE